MKREPERRKRLETVLRDVYRQAGRQQPTSLKADWQTSVLRQIRSLPEPGDQVPLAWLFQQYLWRLAPAAGVLILIMAIWLAQGNLSPDAEMAALALNNPANFDLIEVLGL
jgi:hypothetical protein